MKTLILEIFSEASWPDWWIRWDTENSKKILEQNELSDKIKLKDFLGIKKFDTEKLREIIKVIRVHSQDEIEIEWNFDDIFSEQR